MTIEYYFGTLQQSSVEAWKEHLKTDKYSKHKALNEFYDEIVELVDTLIEDYIGIYGKPKDFKNQMMPDDSGVIKYLENLRLFVLDGREELIDKKDTELWSDIDAILSLIDKTLYQLKELKESSFKSLVEFINESLR